MHLQLASLTATPEIAITEADGRAFLGAVQNVMRHYPLTASQKTVDWAALIFTASFIYMPRVAAVRARHGRPAQASQPEFGNVFQFNPGSGVPPQPSQAGTGPQPNGAAPEPPPQPTPGPRVYDIEPEYVS